MAAPDNFPPLEGNARLLATLALSLATFMNVLDTTIANVSLPAIAGDMGVSPNQGTWVITSFAVANAISVPLTGWLTQRFGQVRLFVTSVLLFHAGLVPVRHGQQPAYADWIPYPAGGGRRAHDPVVAGTSAFQLPEVESRYGLRRLVDDHAGGARHGTNSRRLDFR